jgi:hypothetical protein
MNQLVPPVHMLMHESRHKLMERVNQIKSDAIKAGSLTGSRLIVTAVKAADGEGPCDRARLYRANGACAGGGCRLGAPSP